MFTTRRLLATLGVTALAFVLAAQAADPEPVKKADGRKVEDLSQDQITLEQANAILKQDQLKRQFDDFKQSLLRLAHRLESSPRPEDRDKATVLKEAIKKASEQGV